MSYNLEWSEYFKNILTHHDILLVYTVLIIKSVSSAPRFTASRLQQFMDATVDSSN